MQNMRVRFWGVRGSVPVPGETTKTVGGNTSCVEVAFGGERIIFDAGTGIRALGDELMASGCDATLMLSHLHWDHIQGLPFFAPIYRPDTRLEIIGRGDAQLALPEALAQQMQPPTFPMLWSDLPSQITSQSVRHGQVLKVRGAEVRCARLTHPGGGVLAYRVDWNGQSVVYATDTEHYSCIDPVLQKLAEGVDLLIYDSQYTPEEYSGEVGMARTGWGHSTYEAGARLAKAAGARALMLFHHDPRRDDDGVAEIEARARKLFRCADACREGATYDVRRRERAA